MSVTFNEEPQAVRTVGTAPTGLYALAIRWGFAENQKQAEVVLLSTVGITLLAIIGIWIMGSGAPEGPTNEELIRMQQAEGV